MSTIKDVARLAGVSLGTVSNYLNHPQTVSPAKAKAIEAAIRETRYRPNALGKSLRTGRGTDVGVVLPDLEDPCHVALLSGIDAYFRKTDLTVSVATSAGDPQEEARAVSRLAQRGLRGLVILSCRPEGLCAGETFPIVEVDRRSGLPGRGFVTFGHRETYFQVAARFLAQGCRRLVLLTGPLDFTGEALARAGFTAALDEAGVPEEERSLLSCRPTRADAFRAATQLISRLDPQAVVCTSQALALGVYEGLSLLCCDLDRTAIAAPGRPLWSQGAAPLVPIERPAFRLGWEAGRIVHGFADLPEEGREVCLPDKLPGFSASSAAPLLAGAEPPLRALMLDNPQTEFLERLLPRFREETGLTVEIHKCPHGALFQAIGQGRDSHDVFAFNLSWLHTLLGRNLLADLGPHMEREGFDPGIYLPGSLERFGVSGGRYYGLPYVYTPELLYYRRDLFESPALQARYLDQCGCPLRPPKTWQEFSRTAAFFTRDRVPESPTRYGTVVPAAYTACLVPELYRRLASTGGRVFDGTFQVCFSSPQALGACRLLLEALDLAPDQAPRTNYKVAADLFRQGDAAMLVTYPTFTSDICALGRGEDTGYTLVPGNASLLGGYSLGVSRWSKRQAHAFRFVRWACGEELAGYSALLAAHPPVNSVYRDRDLFLRCPWLPLFLEAYQTSQPIPAPHAPGRSAIPRPVIDEILCAHLLRAFRRECAPDDAVEAAQAELSGLFSRFGYPQRGTR